MLRPHFDFYKTSDSGRLLRSLAINDATYWASNAFITIIFALFVIENIEGGSATNLGIAIMIYRITIAVISIPIGKIFDKHKGLFDEVMALAFSSFAAGSMYFLLSYSTQIYQLYIAMVIIGLATAVDIVSWRILFYGQLKKGDYGATVGIYQTFMSITQGIAVALSGFVGDTYGFEWVLRSGGIVIFLGGFMPLMIKHIVSSKSSKIKSQDSSKEKQLKPRIET